ncbi:hypothetical protein A8990_13561 [Paenibacillus taihuensis]|uniref:RNA-binding protein with PIN domain n=1 Tax=Paenibacillus taihuensis TaxID=1156355 RepID=A0A3D9R228_9BACL|nr:NYN domain-containing protein [Paenibacillus taihuensis]REE68866.1 hypothetical protein A8990_13561 [Paenibacillus taihuensis]
MKRRDDVLLVDGYNMIGAWPELAALRDKDFEDARDRLLEMLADYQGFTGMTVIVVFDAHQVPGIGKTFKQRRLTVVFTKEKETADACIERLASDMALRSRNIHVATSDMIEQHVIFGKGALRKSARELLTEIKQSRKAIQHKVEQKASVRNELDSNLKMDIRMKLEKMRRGEL